MHTHSIASPLQLLGVGSDMNRRLKVNLQEALRELSLNIAIEEVHDLRRLLQHDISGIPALLVNGKVIYQQEVPSVDDLKVVLSALLGTERFLGAAERVVVPTDFSPVSLNALDYALALARGQELPVELVHIEPSPNGASRRLRELVERYREDAGVELAGQVHTGAVGVELERLTHESRCLLVMGSTGQNGRAAGWLGSLSRRIALRAACPVLLVPPGARFRGFRSIVYASGHQPAEESVLPKVADLASGYQAHLYFVHVHADSLHSFRLRHGATTRATGPRGELVELANVYSSDVVQGLLDFSRRVDADLLVAATSRRHFLERLIVPGTTQRVMRQLDWPLLVFHL